jgi:hypothetical protein
VCVCACVCVCVRVCVCMCVSVWCGAVLMRWCRACELYSNILWLWLPQLLDFPPLWRVVDAHAAWHFATVPLVSLWYSFLWSDVAWEASKQAADDSGCGKRK